MHPSLLPSFLDHKGLHFLAFLIIALALRKTSLFFDNVKQKKREEGSMDERSYDRVKTVVT